MMKRLVPGVGIPLLIILSIWLGLRRTPEPEAGPRMSGASIVADGEGKTGRAGLKPAPAAMPERSGLDSRPADRPDPRIDVAGRTEPASTSEKEDFLARARVLQERATPPDEKGVFMKRRVVEVTGFKHRHLRIEESWTKDARTGEESMKLRQVMVADHFLVSLQPGKKEEDLLAELGRLGGRVRRHLPNSQVYLVETGSPELDVFDLKLREFRLEAASMKVVEPDYVVFAQLTPNDPSFSSLWGLHNTGQTGGTGDVDIDAPEAWEVARGADSVVVGVIDTGIDYNHPDLAANMWVNAGEIPDNSLDDDGNGYVDDVRGWDFVSNDKDPADDHYHGTHCAGTIGAVGDNGTGVAGVCHMVRLMALKFLSGSGGGTTADAVEAVRYATASGVTLTSNSWGGGGYSQTLKDAIDEAAAAGILFVAAAGNDSSNTDLSPSYPACYDSANIISVAASDHNDTLASFTNYGAMTVDLAAPGVGIYSTSPGSSYRSLNGTSMACPHVAGSCALIKAARPAMNWQEIKSALLDNVDGVAGMNGKVLSQGRLNVARSLIIATEPYVTLSAITPLDNGQLGSVGNGDGILNPGEDIALGVILKNVGAQPALGAGTTLTVTSAGSKVTVLQGDRTWGNIPVNDSVSTGASPFRIRIAADTVTPHPVTLRLVTTDAGGGSWTSEVQMTVLTSSSITGRVTALTGGAGISGALVSYSGSSTGSVTTAADGSYTLKVTDGTYQVRASAAGYNPSQEVAVTVPPDAASVNFSLGRSRVQVTPSTLASTQLEDTLVTRTLTVTNEGDQPLTFNVSTAPRSSALALEATPRIQAAAVSGISEAAPEVQPTGFKALLRAQAGSTSLPFSDSFESGSLSGWANGSGSGTREIVTGTAAAGTRSFHYDYQGGTSHFHGISRDFVSGAKPKAISFWVRSGSTTTHDGYCVLTDGTYGAEAIWFFARGTGKFYVNGDVGGDESFSYQAGVWYKVEFRDLNWSTKNFDYYVDGSLVKADIPFRNPSSVNQISQLWLYNFSTGSEAWWDDVRVLDTSLDWLTPDPVNGTLAPGQSSTVTVSFDAIGKVVGSYLGQVDISSNDPANPVVTVPVTMTVQPAPNTPPVADTQAVTLDEDSRAVITLTGTDAEGHVLTAQLQSLPAVGTLYQTTDGTTLGTAVSSVPAIVTHPGKKLIYVPPPNVNGIPCSSFDFIMRDKRSQSAPARVTLNVNPLNDPPVAFDDSVSGLPEQVITPISVLANDLEPDGQVLSISSFTQGQKGAVAANGDGTLSYTPQGGFTSGVDSFTYTISDGAGGSSTATVQVAVGLLAAGSWPMMGRDAAHTGLYPGSLNGEVLSPAWTLQVSPQPLNQVSVAEGRAFVTPDIYFNETQLSAVDLATGTLVWKKTWPVQARSLNGPAYHSGTVFVQRGNHATDSQLWALNSLDGSTRWSTPFNAQWEEYLPPTVTDEAVYVNGGTYGGMYGYNRSTGSQLFFSSLEQFGSWTPAFHNNKVYSFVSGRFRQHHPTSGTIEWSLDLGWNWDGYTMGRTTAIASGAAFVINNRAGGNELVCIDLNSKTVRWRVQTGFTGTPSVSGSRVLAFDSTGNVRAHDVTTGVLQQTYVTGIGATGLYQPIITQDVLIASSATATAIHSLATGSKLQAIAAGGIPSLSNGFLLLAGTDGRLRCYTVLGDNTAPVATAQTASCTEDETVTLTLAGSDADGGSLTGIISALPARGTLYQTTDGVQIGEPITLAPVLVRNPQRQVIYRPAMDGFGSPYTTFTFRVNDGSLSSADATVTLDVTNVNDAPLAADDEVYMRAGGILEAYLPTANDKDVDGEALNISSFTQPTRGILAQNGNGSLRYEPQPDFTEGTDSFQYTLQDGAGARSSATVTVHVSASHGLDWSQFGNGPDHPGRYPGALGVQAWVERWSYAFSSAINPLAIGGGRVFVTPTGNSSNYMHAVALDAVTGGEIWRTQFMPGNSMNPPSYHKGLVYLQRGNHSTDTQLWALDAGDGGVKWSGSHQAQWESYLAPAVSDLGVFVNGGYYGGMLGFDTVTGSQRFYTSLEQYDEWTPAIHDSKVYSFVEGRLRQHDPQTGVTQWMLDLGWDWGGWAMGRTLCMNEGSAYLINNKAGGGELVCVNLSTRSVIWRVQAGFNGTPAISNGMVFACSGGTVKAYNSSTGTWIADYTIPGESLLNGSPVVSSDLLFVSSTTRTCIFNLVTRSLLQTLNFGGAAAIADDLLYLSCTDNKVRAFGRLVPTNKVPAALSAQVGIVEEAEVAVTLEGTDADGESLRYVIRSLPAQGRLYQTVDGTTRGAVIGTVPAQVLNTSGRVIYQAPLNIFGNGIGSFTFTAHDPVSGSSAATVTVNIAPVNDAPTAVPDRFSLSPGESLLSFFPQSNDRDDDGDMLQVVAFTQGAGGVVSQNEDGSLNYLPETGFTSGMDSFTYTIRDAAGAESDSTVHITVDAVAGHAWPTFGASAEHTGFLPVRLGTLVLGQRWLMNLGGKAAPLAVAGGRAYTTISSPDAAAVALDCMTGAMVWRASFAAGTTMNPPTYDDGRICLQSGSHSTSQICALHAGNGTTLWSTPFSAQFNTYMAPAADASGIYVNGGYYGGLYGFNPSTGAQLFFNGNLDQYDEWTPTLHEDGAYTFVTGKLRRHDKASGSILWSLNFGWNWSGYDMNRTTAASNGRIYLVNDSVTIPAGDQELICVQTSSNAVAWKVQNRFSGTPAVAHQTVYVISGSNRNSVTAYDAVSGSPLGVYTLPGSDGGLAVQPMVTNDTLIVASSSKTYLFNLATRSLRQTIAFGGRISLSDGSLYIASDNGDIRSFSVLDPANRPPAPIAQNVITEEDVSTVITFQGTDADDDALYFVIQSLPLLGTLHQTEDGITATRPISHVPARVTHPGARLIYLPPADLSGSPFASFQFAVSDGQDLSPSASVAIHVQPVNDPPVARADACLATPGQIVSPLWELHNDVDVEADPLRVVSFTQPALGRVAQNEDGSLRYQAPASLTDGVTSFSYTVADTHDATSSATVTVTLKPTLTASWSTFGGGPAHIGSARTLLGRFGWSQRWSYTATGSGTTLQPPVTAGNLVYVTYRDSGSRLVALRTVDGSQAWSRSFSSAVSMNPPSHHAGRVFVQRINSYDSQVMAMNATTGVTAWSFTYTAQAHVAMAPAIHDSGVFVNGGTYGGMYGINPGTGQQLFHQSMNQYDGWTPSLLDNELYSFVSGDFARHNLATGAVIWNQKLGWGGTGSTMSRTTALEGRRAFLINDSPTSAAGDEDLVCIDLDNGSVAWSVNGEFTGTPAISGSTVFALSGTTIQVRAAHDGMLLTTFSTGSAFALTGQPLVTDDLVIACSSAQTFLFGRYDGSLVATLPVGGHPAVVDDFLVLSSPATGKISAWGSQPSLTFSPAGGTSAQPIDIVISAADSDARIHYSVDGSPPDFNSPWITAGSTVRMGWSGTLRAITIKGSEVSRIHQASFTLEDSDRDGLPDWWEATKFSSLEDSSGSTDSDHDGYSDAEEFVAGTSPLSLAERLGLGAEASPSSPDDSLIFRWPSVLDRLYVLEASEDLTAWTPVSPVYAGTGAEMEHPLPLSEQERKFIRVRVMHALVPP